LNSLCDMNYQGETSFPLYFYPALSLQKYVILSTDVTIQCYDVDPYILMVIIPGPAPSGNMTYHEFQNYPCAYRHFGSESITLRYDLWQYLGCSEEEYRLNPYYALDWWSLPTNPVDLNIYVFRNGVPHKCSYFIQVEPTCYWSVPRAHRLVEHRKGFVDLITSDLSSKYTFEMPNMRFVSSEKYVPVISSFDIDICFPDRKERDNGEDYNPDIDYKNSDLEANYDPD